MRTMKKITAIFVTLMLAVGCMFIPGDKAAAATDMTAASLHYNTSSKNTAVSYYIPSGSGYTTKSITVKDAGKLYIDASATSGMDVEIGKFSGNQPTDTKWKYISAGDSITSGIGGYDVSPGTYWVGFKSYSGGTVQFTAYVMPYSTRFLPANKIMCASGYKGNYQDSAARFKIVPTATGFINVGLVEYGYSNSAGYVTLLNSSGTPVSDKLWYYSSSNTSYVMFGVQKGVTYYLMVNGACGNSDNHYGYGIKYTLKSAPIRKNTKKSKALNLKRKAKAKVVAIPATNKKKTQWYKFKVTKKRKTQIRVDASAMKSGSAKIIIYCGKKKVGSANMSLGNVHTYTVTHSTTYGKANKGKYYVKITTNAKCSGTYSVRYLK